MSAKTVRMLVRLGISGAVFLFFLLHTAGLWPSRLLTTLENVTYDSRILLTMPQTVDPRVVIVDIDDRSITAEGFPLPRDKWGQVITNLFERYRVRTVGFDVVFGAPDRAAGREMLERLAAGPLAELPGFRERIPEYSAQLDTDRMFADAIRGHPVILGYAFASEGALIEQAQTTGAICAPLYDKAEASQYAGVGFLRQQAYLGNLPVLQDATPYCGFFDLPTLDEDGVIRTVPLLQMHDGKVYPTLALAVARAALGDAAVALEFEPPDARTSLNLERVRIGDRVAPVNEQVAVMAPYRGRLGSFPYVSVTDVIRGTADPKVLEGAIVFVGTSAAGLKDMRTTPVGQAYAGVEIHANILSALLDGTIKHRPSYYSGMETTMLLVIGLLMALLFPRLPPLWAFAMAVGVVAVAALLALAFWRSAHLVVPMGVPIVFTIALFMVQQLYGYLIETRRSRDISRRFGEYVPPEIVEQMADNPESVSMEGKSRDMTVLFSDVRGFTSVSEQLEAKDLAELMNQFLTLLTRVIQKHRGTIDKYMGDAIMAFWGAPLEDPRHAEHALAAAIELPKAIRTLDAGFAKRGWPALQIGVGLSTGVMRVGNMGSEFRRAYTVMGDPVNLGSRVEGLTKEYGAAVICSEFTRNAGPSDWSYRELDRVRVKGKDEPVTIYEPIGPKGALSADLRQELARHRGALKMYRAQQWDAAEAEFFSLSRTAGAHKVYEMFLERIAYYRKNPPGEKWDGVFTFKTK